MLRGDSNPSFQMSIINDTGSGSSGDGINTRLLEYSLKYLDSSISKLNEALSSLKLADKSCGEGSFLINGENYLSGRVNSLVNRVEYLINTMNDYKATLNDIINPPVAPVVDTPASNPVRYPGSGGGGGGRIDAIAFDEGRMIK